MKGKGLLALSIGLMAGFSGLFIYAMSNYPRIQYVRSEHLVRKGEYLFGWEWFPVSIPNNPAWVSFLQSEISLLIFIGLFVFIALAAHRAYPESW